MASTSNVEIPIPIRFIVAARDYYRIFFLNALFLFGPRVRRKEFGGWGRNEAGQTIDTSRIGCCPVFTDATTNYSGANVVVPIVL